MAAKKSALVVVLALLGAVLMLLSSVVAISTDDGGQPYHFTSLRGENVEIYGGNGLYRYDNIIKAALFRGYDYANLVVCLPLIVLGVYLYRRGHQRGQLLLAAIFVYLAYNYIIGVMGNSYNNLFLVWTSLFATGIWGVFVLAAGMDIPSLPRQLKIGFPVKSAAVYMAFLGIYLFVQYMAEILTALTTGMPPFELQSYTTLELAALELGIMIPLHIVGAILLWRRNAWGYFLAIVLAFAACMTFISLTVGQILLYFSLQRGSPADIIIPLVLTVIAAGFSLTMFARVKDRERVAVTA